MSDRAVLIALGIGAALSIGIGVFCFAAIDQPIQVALLAGIGAFFSGLTLMFMVWAVSKMGI